ncbi:MAG: hypothetical protein AAGF12_00625 [Myxococcota bacterium]
MGAGIFNLIIGGLMVAGGLSGRFTLLGTNSTEALAGLGAAICAYGIYQIVRSRRSS